MRRASFRGAACIEFAFIAMVLVPLLLGTGAAGINMILTLQTIQLARDAGHMYARGLDFSQPGNQTILANVGSTLGLSTTAGSGSAVVILSKLTYVDNAACAAAGAVDSHGNPSGCTNLARWVFTQRLDDREFEHPHEQYRQPANQRADGEVTVNSTTGNIIHFGLCDQGGRGGHIQLHQPIFQRERGCIRLAIRANALCCRGCGDGIQHASIHRTECDIFLWVVLTFREEELWVRVSIAEAAGAGLAMVLFTTMLPTLLIPLVGLAIDGSRLYIVQAQLASAVDGAALGAGRLLGTTANTTEIAGEFLNANFPTGFWGSTNLTPNITATSSFTTHTITVSATVNVPLLFMRIFGSNHSMVAASAIATRKETRVEMVIDRSGSMTELSSVIATSTQFTESFISGYDELGLVAFASSGVVGYPTGRPYNSSPTSAGGPDTNFETTQTNGNMLTMLSDIGSNGYTNMSEGLALAYIELQKANNRDKDPTRLNAIVLFTDGVPNAFSSYANDPEQQLAVARPPCARTTRRRRAPRPLK